MRRLVILLSMVSAVTGAGRSLARDLPYPAWPDMAAGARIVVAILGYTRWSQPRPSLTLCLIGHADRDGDADRALGEIGRAVTAADPRIVSRLTPAYDISAITGCDALYLGRLGADAMRAWIGRAQGAPVVTIAEDDPDCVSNAMFCLVHTPAKVSFKLNIDAVSRSAVRIDPRVLRISIPPRGGER